MQKVCANQVGSHPSLGWEERCELRQTRTMSCIKLLQSISGIDLRNNGSNEGICLKHEQLNLNINIRIHNRRK